MGRGKLKMELIENEKSRRLTFQKRKKGLTKKCSELSTLCGIDVCTIIYGPNNHTKDPSVELETWPKDHIEVIRIIQRYQAATIYKPPKKTSNLSDFYIERKKNIDSKIDKLRKAKYPISDELITHYCASSGDHQLGLLLGRLDSKIEAVKRMIEFRKQNQVINYNPHDHVDHLFDQKFVSFNNNNIPQLDQMVRSVPMPQYVYPNPMIDHNQMRMMMMMNDQAAASGYDHHQNVAAGTSSSSDSVVDYNQYSLYSNNPLSSGGGTGFFDPTVGMVENYMLLNNIGNNSIPSSSTSQYCQQQQPLQMMPIMQYYPSSIELPGIPSQMNVSDHKGKSHFDEITDFYLKNEKL
ncbi:MADS-box transcription factor 18 [Ziziphus jujuba]|uniref:MADS-box transcription factor 18 n=1 Tax=Ziziphus jujuba TaxID=326968 RepID=A0ABM3IPR3_ZIZJJ|nr:MADS-box transcription factor 18 [Ziziphus jujuba]